MPINLSFVKRQFRADVQRSASHRVTVAALLPLAAGYFLSYLFRNVNGVIAADIMRDLAIGADALGTLTSVYFLIFAAAQLPVGVLLDRYGPRRIQCALLLCASVGAGLCALDGGFGSLLLGRALIGLGTAGGLVAGLKASSQWFSREQLPAVNGMFIMCGGLGALAATWPVEIMLHLVNWRALSGVLAVATGLVALTIYGFVPDQQRATEEVTDAVRLRDLVRDPMFQRFAPLSATCFGAVLAVQGLWAGPWLADVDGLPRSEVASDLAYMAAVLIVAAPSWGLLTQRLRQRVKLTHVAVGAAIVLVAAETMIFVPVGLPHVMPWCLFALFGGMSVLSYSVLADHFPPAAIGRANGVLNVLHIGCSFAIQLGFGQVIALWSPVAGHYPAHAYQAALMLPIGMQVAALLWFACPRRAPHSSDCCSSTQV